MRRAAGQAARPALGGGFATACFSRWTAADYPIEFPPECSAARAAGSAGGGNLFRLRDTGMIFL